jgi:hypothetical protein
LADVEQRVHDGRVQVRDRLRIASRFAAVACRLPDDLAHRQAAAGQQQRRAAAPVVAAATTVDARRPPHFAGGY